MLSPPRQGVLPIQGGRCVCEERLPRPTPGFTSLAELDSIAEVTVREEFTFLDLSSSSRLAKIGVSRVRQTNQMFVIVLTQVSISSLFLRFVWQCICLSSHGCR